jgi:hypothetical protein
MSMSGSGMTNSTCESRTTSGIAASAANVDPYDEDRDPGDW